MQEDFYRRLEDQFRGSRASIKERLQVYQGFLAALKEHLSEHRALDLGCGRGEWLEVLTEVGFEAKGVDLDDGMLQACLERKLVAYNKDALTALKETPDNSLAIVSALHLVEHLPLDTLMAIATEAHRVLMPGGLLLLETPNSENIYTGISNFYLDPTHNKPIPAELLKFLTQYCGFDRSSIVRVNQMPHMAQEKNLSLRDVVFYVSPDYAVIAQKKSTAALRDHIDFLLEKTSGSSLWDTVERYDSQQRKNMSAALYGAALSESVESKISQLQQDQANVWQNVSQLQQDQANVWQNVSQLHQANHDLHQNLVAINATLERIRRPVRKLMAPVRWAKNIFKKLLGR